MNITPIQIYNNQLTYKSNQLNIAKNANFSQTNSFEFPKYSSTIPFLYNINFRGNAVITPENTEILKTFREFQPNLIPDSYQLEAAQSISDGNSTIVTAPTGTGKTLLAEFAIYKNLKEGKRTFYTTPLKALTNQKYLDFKKEFGERNVGIMTGDIKENCDAPIILMTTEIYRNMLKNGSAEDIKEKLNNVKTVILDEFHYMNDIDRGVIWEESIMNSPPYIQLISLSATVKNADKICEWMKTLPEQNDVKLINVPSNERYVPLRFYHLDNQGRYASLTKFTEPHIALEEFLPPKNISQRTKDAIEELGKTQNTPEDNLSAGFNILKEIFSEKQTTTYPVENLADEISKKTTMSEKDALKIALILSRNMPIKEQEEFIPRTNSKDLSIFDYKKEKQAMFSKINVLLDCLDKQSKANQFDGFPAIVFLFSRKGCEIAAEKYYRHTIQNGCKNIAKYQEERLKKQKQILDIISRKSQEGKILGIGFNQATKQRLLAGIGVHHAGMLPAYKSLIEELFQKKLLDVVFATETLSAGINMPAKTTVITALKKPGNNSSIRELTINEFQQMAGRAGRRGIDNIGYVVTMPSGRDELRTYKSLATEQPNPIQSKFDISTSDVIEILKENNGIADIEKIKDFVKRSFAVYSSPQPEKATQKYVDEFKTLLDILKKTGYITESSNKRFLVQPKAKILPEIKGVNEIFLGELISSGALARLAPSELVSTIAAISTENSCLPTNPKEIKSMIEEVNSDIEYSLFEVLPYLAKTNNLLNNYNLKKPAMVCLDPYLAFYTREFILSEEKNYVKRWDNILKMMKEDGQLYFEGNFFYSLNMTLDILKQIKSAAEIMAKDKDSQKDAAMYETLAENAKIAMEFLDLPPLNETI